jgi:hypothetical protein
LPRLRSRNCTMGRAAANFKPSRVSANRSSHCFLMTSYMVTNSWHGRPKVSVIFLSSTRRNTANLKRQSLTPYKSLPLAIHTDHKTLQTAPQTEEFIRPLPLIAHFRHADKFLLPARCRGEINHATGAASHWKSKKQPANGDKTTSQCHYSRINKRHLAGTTVFPFRRQSYPDLNCTTQARGWCDLRSHRMLASV